MLSNTDKENTSSLFPATQLSIGKGQYNQGQNRENSDILHLLVVILLWMYVGVVNINKYYMSACFEAWVSSCSVFCQAHRPDPKGEMQVNQTCCSELEFHNLSPPPCSLISTACRPPFCAVFETKLLSSNGDNCSVIDFFLSYSLVSKQCGLPVTWLSIPDWACSPERLER